MALQTVTPLVLWKMMDFSVLAGVGVGSSTTTTKAALLVPHNKQGCLEKGAEKLFPREGQKISASNNSPAEMERNLF